ncbi:hypothetical protein AURDEDRAFT_166618 [Auricularia subglabra TFB-10046 SS5]|nr:hypothetical protein AURDEDRAFT_166618 [Auricularia subglabra TFB-10046 SS5]
MSRHVTTVDPARSTVPSTLHPAQNSFAISVPESGGSRMPSMALSGTSTAANDDGNAMARTHDVDIVDAHFAAARIDSAIAVYGGVVLAVAGSGLLASEEQHDTAAGGPTSVAQPLFRAPVEISSPVLGANDADTGGSTPTTSIDALQEVPEALTFVPDLETGLYYALAVQHARIWVPLSRRFPSTVPYVTAVAASLLALGAAGIYLTDPTVAHREKVYALLAVSIVTSLSYTHIRHWVLYPRYPSLVPFVSVVVGESAALGAAAFHVTDPLTTRREVVYALAATSFTLFLSFFVLRKLVHN